MIDLSRCNPLVQRVDRAMHGIIPMSHMMSKRLCVGSLSWETDEDGLRAAFERFGPLCAVEVVRDLASGRPKGMGFVTYVDRVAAVQAIAQMTGFVLDGSTIRISEADDAPT